MNRYKGYSSCWSYVHSDGREYAFELAQTGASVVRLTDPTHPVEVAFFNLVDSEWHEGRQYRHWFYITSELDFLGRNNTGLTIVDMADPDHPKLVSSWHSKLQGAHTIDIDTARGLLYAAGGAGDQGQGTYIYSLANPANPVLLTIYGDGFLNYIHTIHVTGNRGYASMQNLGKVRVLDLTDPAKPSTITEFDTPGGQGPGISGQGTTHSSWPSTDGRCLYVSDEVAGVGLYVYDLQDLSQIHQVYRFEGMPDRTIAHDPVVRENLLFVSYYTAGAHVYDISNPAWPVEVGYFDTFQGRDGGFQGCWEVGPVFPSGIFIASDIETGLYVFRLKASYGIVRGTVQQAANGPLITGAVVSQVPPGPSSVSFSDGRYSIAVDAGSSVTLTYSHFGFDPRTLTVAAAAGSDQTLDVSLRLSDAGALAGVVRRTSDSSGLSGGEISVLGTPLRTVTGADGAFSFHSVPAGTYQVRCLRPGQVPTVLSATVARSKTTNLNFSLANALTYDDAEVDRGWALGARFDDATQGLWTRGVPNGTFDSRTGDPVQTSQDHTPDAGVACFLTGNAALPPTYIFSDDVSNGQTTLTSPVFHFRGVEDPRIGFWRWYVNYVFELTPDDPLVTQLSNDGGNTWVSVDSTYELAPGWQYMEIPVANTFASPGDVQLRIIAQDRGAFDCVEAAIDDISSYPGAGGGTLAASLAREAPLALVGRPRPSPTRGLTRLDLSLPRAVDVRADVFDVQGRLVRTIQDGMLPAGLHVLTWDGRLGTGVPVPAGSYWWRINAGGVTRSSRLIVLR